MSIYNQFKNSANNSPDKLALVLPEQEVSYKQLLVYVDNLTENLVESLNSEHKIIITLLQNSLEQTTLMLALSQLGWSWLPLSQELSLEQIENYCNIPGDKVIVTDFSYKSRVDKKELAHRLSSVFSLGLDSDADDCDIKFGLNRSGKKLNFQVDLDAPFILTMSSGTTGEPKLITFSQQTKLNRAKSAYDCYKLSSDDVFLAHTPQYHSLAQRLTFLPLMNGATLILGRQFSAQTWVENVKKHHVTFTISVSSQLIAILNYLNQTDTKITTLRRVVSSSATLSSEYKQQLLTMLNCELHECYGASEVGTVTDIHVNQELNFYKSVGKPISGVQIKIIGNSSEELAANQVGEIAVYTPLLFCGYYQDEEKTLSSMHGNYFLTGDLGYVDEQGYLYFKGRKKELIISGGINVFPEDIETVINKYEGIKESIAYSKTHPYLGEVVAAVFTADENIDTKRLKQFCRAKLALYQLPISFKQVSDLKKTATGKPKRALYSNS
ncbi:class I adenylate-forming enzyme family protein [Pseudoalteromonas sp. SS15]|uniref:class I adenylate-forming enzyme family protein n=1 Tax=Pseudoalteromonas sp. SS15 TaxID=3139393 RepID=UPI003BA9C62E